MKGQRLFVRAIEETDREAVQSFLESEGRAGDLPACGLLGKLVGDLVAVLEMRITADSVEVHEIVVARDLRRKRIGRVMLAELEQIARKIERQRLVVPETQRGTQDGAAEFLRRVGFEREGSRWIREVRK